ncbi:4-hydroxy-3-methylbut-2-enyl diphosphate reductase [bacterium]|nr:4-hydroxy-3-methylbut-2-enyl diphosphate reductase [bacterium]
MRVNVLKNSGFCGGVTRALYLLDKAIRENSDKTIYLLHEIVHNDIVNDKYNKLGVKVIEEKDLDGLSSSSIVLSSAHGISNLTREKLNRFNHIDATCPFVRNNQKIIQASKASEIIFIGKKNHRETIAMTEDNKNIWVIENENDLKNYKSHNEGEVYNQTTFNVNKLNKIHEILEVNCPKYEIFNTMCESTRSLQNSLKSVDPRYNVCVIVGDKKSSNANSLFEMSPYIRTEFIENEKDVDKLKLCKVDSVLVVGSASTPKDVLEKVKNSIKERFPEN